jgi:alpha-tubulin suppressor-like RCC1 family protein
VPGEMGDALPEIDLGRPEFSVKDFAVGDYHNCALLNNDRVKCWGAHMFSGDTEPRGDDGDDMGAMLPFVDLGNGQTVLEISAGAWHMCARLIDQRLKCWGDNESGQLGIGDTGYRGGQPGDMGDNLRATELGSDLRVAQLAAGRLHTCARFDDGRVKCWGDNSHGQLGLGDQNHRGDQIGEMGDALPFVDLGTEQRAVLLATQEYHTCAVLEDGAVKCWGANDNAQLGLGEAGDDVDRGDDPGEMGDALPFVDLGGM